MTVIIILIIVLSFLTLRMSKITSQANTYNVLDFGFFIAVLICVYTIFPSISYLIFKDDLILLGSRVYNLQPTDNEVAYLLLISISLVFGIFISYKLTPSNYNFDYKNITIIPNKVFKNSIWVLIISSILVNLIKYKYGLFNPGSYNEVYTSNWKMPIIIRQFFLVFSEAQTFTKIILLIYFLQKRNIKTIVLFFLVFLLISFDPSKARAGLFINLLLLLSTYQLFISKFSKRKTLMLAIFGLFAFTLLGVFRSQNSEGILPSTFLLVGEFNNIWANAIHISQLKLDESFLIPISVRLNEFIAFIPSQLLPFEKLSVSNWYMETFYPKSFEHGNGLGFGIIAQSISDGGIFFGVLRGFILGKLFLFLKKSVLFSNKWWVFPVYIVFFLGLYSSVRTSSLGTFTTPVIKLLFFILLLKLSFKPKQL